MLRRDFLKAMVGGITAAIPVGLIVSGRGSLAPSPLSLEVVKEANGLPVLTMDGIPISGDLLKDAYGYRLYDTFRYVPDRDFTLESIRTHVKFFGREPEWQIIRNESITR